MSKLLITIILFCLGNILIWFQTNGQFLWRWFDKHPVFLSIVFGGVISYFFIYATKIGYNYFDGLLWPVKFVGFSVGILTYAGLTYYFMSESLSLKTIICLVLAFLIIGIQVLWK
jgi:hypothetical protein|tara:strand:- start:2614 stop:2958 length:345 start_codon:yes stop_codon:yes gene_type:complete